MWVPEPIDSGETCPVPPSICAGPVYILSTSLTPSVVSPSASTRSVSPHSRSRAARVASSGACSTGQLVKKPLKAWASS